MGTRIPTDYPGVIYRVAKRISGKGEEKVFYVRYKKDGKICEEKVGRQYADAMTPARASLIRSELIDGKRLTRKEKRIQDDKKKQAAEARWTVDRLWNSYREDKENDLMENQKPLKTLKVDDGRYLNYLKDILGHKEPHEINQHDIKMLKFRHFKGKSDQTKVHVYRLLERISNYGYKEKNSQKLGCHIEKPKLNNIKIEDLTGDQLEALLQAIDDDENIQAANLMRMVLFSGMRRGELFKLKWADVDFDRGFITIKDPKGGPNQVIPMNDGARGVLKSHVRTKSPYVFPGRGGRQRVDINKQVNRIKTRAGLPKGFRPLHGLRHVYASMLASSGQVDLYTLQKLLTHKDPRMTQRYAHLRDQTLKDASQVAGDIVNGAMKGKKDQKKVVNIHG